MSGPVIPTNRVLSIYRSHWHCHSREAEPVPDCCVAYVLVGLDPNLGRKSGEWLDWGDEKIQIAVMPSLKIAFLVCNPLVCKLLSH